MINNDKLQAILIVITIISTLFAGLLFLYNHFSQPDYMQGKFFNNAWIDYGTEENILTFEYAYGDFADSIPAFAEVIKRTATKLPLNNRLRSKPLVVVATTRPPGNTQLIEIVRFTLQPEDISQLSGHYDQDFRYRYFEKVWANCVIPDKPFIIEKTNATTHRVTHSKIFIKKSPKMFQDIASELNSTRMQTILDNL